MKKQSKKLLLWSVVVLFLAGFAVLIVSNGGNSSQRPTEYSASALAADEADFDFGTISMKDGNVSHQFQIRNDGDELVVIQKVYTSCMCTTASLTDSDGKTYGTFGMPGHGGPSAAARVEVDPGEIIRVDAVFDPAAHGPSGVGLAERSVYLETNSQKSPKLELTFQAMVTR
ncbi:MAG: DUF1573 domain-containing protein [Candidatus Niyogibacteria bacterium]|nr:DUF1573 domain-containing protein [Candidatus Niyogibacteria bacterium]